MQLFFCSKEWQQWQGKLQPLEDETGYKEAKMKAVGSTSWNWTDKRNILSHANLFRYFKIFNKCIDFGCMFIVVHKSWGPANEYWLLTNKKKAEVPNCFLMVVQGGLGPVDYVSQWLSHQRGDGYCMQWSSWFLSCPDRARHQSWFKIFFVKILVILVTGRPGWSCCWRWWREAPCTWSPIAFRSWIEIEPLRGRLSAWEIASLNHLSSCVKTYLLLRYFWSSVANLSWQSSTLLLSTRSSMSGQKSRTRDTNTYSFSSWVFGFWIWQNQEKKFHLWPGSYSGEKVGELHLRSLGL